MVQHQISDWQWTMVTCIQNSLLSEGDEGDNQACFDGSDITMLALIGDEWGEGGDEGPSASVKSPASLDFEIEILKA